MSDTSEEFQARSAVPTRRRLLILRQVFGDFSRAGLPRIYDPLSLAAGNVLATWMSPRVAE